MHSYWQIENAQFISSQSEIPIDIVMGQCTKRQHNPAYYIFNTNIDSSNGRVLTPMPEMKYAEIRICRMLVQ